MRLTRISASNYRFRQAIVVDSAFPKSIENNKFIESKLFETRILYGKYLCANNNYAF